MSIGSGRCSGTETKPAPGSGSNRGSRPSLIWPAARSSASSTVGNSAAGEGVIDDQSQLVATPGRGRGHRPQGGVPVRGAFLAAPRPGSTLNISTRSSSPTTCSPRSAAASPGTPTIDADATPIPPGASAAAATTPSPTAAETNSPTPSASMTPPTRSAPPGASKNNSAGYWPAPPSPQRVHPHHAECRRPRIRGSGQVETTRGRSRLLLFHEVGQEARSRRARSSRVASSATSPPRL